MDEAQAHRHFSATCFNEVWDLLDLPERSPEQDRLMLEMAHASLYHWLRREDGDARSVSIGLWQISRVCAVLGRTAEALRYAEDCLEISEARELAPFFRGYAHEAAARASQVAGDNAAAARHLRSAGDWLDRIEDGQERTLLATDLEKLGGDGDGAST